MSVAALERAERTSGTSADHIGPDPNDARVTRILDGVEQPPSAFEDALQLTRTRFGCVFHALPRDMQHQYAIIREAAIGSCGHELRHVPEEVRHALGPTFFVDLIDHDVPPWVATFASSRVQTSDAVHAASARWEERREERWQQLTAGNVVHHAQASASSSAESPGR